MQKRRAVLETVHLTALGVWVGALGMTAAVAAIIFPAMRDLDPVVERFAAYPQDHWVIAAGWVMARVFFALDVAQLGCAALAVVTIFGLFIMKKTPTRWRRLRMVLVIGTVGSVLWYVLMVAQPMNADLASFWREAQAGNVAEADAYRAAFDARHPVASRFMGITGAAGAGDAGDRLLERTSAWRIRRREGVVSVATPANPRGLRDIPFELPEVSDVEKRRARRILAKLREKYPEAHCELTYSSPHELLAATILSAQTTDVNVNKATPALFERFPTPADFAAATPKEIEPYVKSLGFFRNKAKSLHQAMKSIVEEFDGEVPRAMEELLSLRGVARKTANVVLGNAFGINVGFVVDTHIDRFSKRFDLAPEDATVTMVERRLMALFPRDSWAELSHMIIWHGRRVCHARGGGSARRTTCARRIA